MINQIFNLQTTSSHIYRIEFLASESSYLNLL